MESDEVFVIDYDEMTPLDDQLVDLASKWNELMDANKGYTILIDEAAKMPDVYSEYPNPGQHGWNCWSHVEIRHKEPVYQWCTSKVYE